MDVLLDAGRAALRPFLALTVTAGLLIAGPALAAEKKAAKPAPQPAAQTLPVPKQIGTYDAWTSVELAQSSGKICYMFARPETSEPKGAKRGDIMMVITHRPAAKSHDEVSFQAGYPFKEGTPVTVDVDGKKFSFFTKPDVDPDAAWSSDPAADKAIVASMKAGKTAKVRGASARGTETVDTFKLAGFGKAYAEIGKACGVK